MDTSAPSLILIVDDETKIRRIVASNLERAGYDVISAADGMHALEILELQSPKPALVLMDVMMPEMDGFECACRIRELGETPIIFMTAKADSNSKLKGFNLGADDYVCKPFSMEELLARIKAVLRRTQAKNNSSASEFTWLVNGPIRICIEKRQCIFNGREVHLGDIEFRLLSLFVKDPGVLHEHNELLNKVWGANALGEVQYLRVACARLRRKFEDAGLEGGIISAYSGVGYVMRDLRDEDQEAVSKGTSSVPQTANQMSKISSSLLRLVAYSGCSESTTMSFKRALAAEISPAAAMPTRRLSVTEPGYP